MHKQTAMRSVSTVTAFLHFTPVVQSEALILYYIPYLNERERWKLKPNSNLTQTQLNSTQARNSIVILSLDFYICLQLISLNSVSKYPYIRCLNYRALKTEKRPFLS